MPLVVPGLQSKDGKDDWMGKLMGKSLGDTHNETVRSPYYRLLSALPTTLCMQVPRSGGESQFVRQASADKFDQTFAKQDLPKEHRVLKPDSMSTMDHKPERLNIHVGEDGTVQNVRYG
ncbi:hypothetical protein BU25DRAFT_406577 [Macroventuria anomochaeta]|uniref:Uncharacterized protein n=1 Tax=Macroventuria anomochaeta TaxID=301207 RepID=A0ACB6SD38_9PLEO|nr:uncharacterized protein BU25DRAFT_406577 [Macroventuria anomochaeta]KAF2632066.1 hypothetical protein BU25DRAFT_406577 [Macroventuria anomochaeta]